MKSILDKDFVYVREKDMGPDYLAKKFAQIRREMRKQQPEPHVIPIKVKQHG